MYTLVFGVWLDLWNASAKTAMMWTSQLFWESGPLRPFNLCRWLELDRNCRCVTAQLRHRSSQSSDNFTFKEIRYTARNAKEGRLSHNDRTIHATNIYQPSASSRNKTSLEQLLECSATEKTGVAPSLWGSCDHNPMSQSSPSVLGLDRRISNANSELLAQEVSYVAYLICSLTFTDRKIWGRNA